MVLMRTFSERDGAMRNTVVSGATNTQHHQRWLAVLALDRGEHLPAGVVDVQVPRGGVPLGDQRGQHPPRAARLARRRHRSHVHVENDVKQAKNLGLNRWPSRHWSVNVAWTQVVALAANPLALLAPPGAARAPVSSAKHHRNCCATGCCTCPPG